MGGDAELELEMQLPQLAALPSAAKAVKRVLPLLHVVGRGSRYVLPTSRRLSPNLVLPGFRRSAHTSSHHIALHRVRPRPIVSSYRLYAPLVLELDDGSTASRALDHDFIWSPWSSRPCWLVVVFIFPSISLPCFRPRLATCAAFIDAERLAAGFTELLCLHGRRGRGPKREGESESAPLRC